MTSYYLRSTYGNAFLVRGPCDGKQLALANLPMSTMAQNSMLASSNTLSYRQDGKQKKRPRAGVLPPLSGRLLKKGQVVTKKA